VLKQLGDSEVAFDAVADLCRLSAEKSKTLQRLSDSDDLRIAACYPRAVRALFEAAGYPLPEAGVSIHNMRQENPAQIVAGLLSEPSLAPEQSDE
jgi:hypothetical protein